jgi:AraC-like DNA-binding protein
VTPRSLQLSFQAVHGMSPRQYLQRVRLDRARQTILAQGDAASVTKAAMDCGFMHLSRFSQVYWRTFGELPSETAARRHSKGTPIPVPPIEHWRKLTAPVRQSDLFGHHADAVRAVLARPGRSD